MHIMLIKLTSAAFTLQLFLSLLFYFAELAMLTILKLFKVWSRNP